MMKYLKLFRVSQWYKNLVIFIPIIFARRVLDFPSLINVIIGFFALCCISSCNYIINDLVDVKKDRIHSEKRERPIAAGEIKIVEAVILAVILFGLSFLISYKLNPVFILWIFALFLSTQIYSFWLKNTAIIDVFLISFNFLIRTTAGIIAANVNTSNWLILITFLLALFLAIGKRYSELILLGKNAEKSKPVFKFYSLEILNSLENITAGLLLAAYSFYTFLAETSNNIMMGTIPIAVFIIFRYLFLVKTGSVIARRTELIVKDKQILSAIIIWCVVSISIYYFPF